MVCHSFVIISLCALTVTSVSPMRHTQYAALMAAEDILPPAAKSVDVVYDGEHKEILDAGENIERAMREQVNSLTYQAVTDMCQDSKDVAKCKSQISIYAVRCKQGDCLTLDRVGYPENKAYQQLVLPDPYQLHAAFLLFKNSRANASRDWLNRFWLRFNRGGRYAAYHSFSVNLLRRNLFPDSEAGELENFIIKYLYTTAIYYKTYLSLDATSAKIINKIAFSRHLFGIKIRRALGDIVKSNMPSKLNEQEAGVIRPLTFGYRHYMATQIPRLPFFAHRFSSMVLKTLIDNLTGANKLPWYKRWLGKVKNFFTGKGSDDEYVVEDDFDSGDAKLSADNKSKLQRMKDSMKRLRRKLSISENGAKDNEASSRKTLSEEEIMNNLSTADVLVQPILDAIGNGKGVGNDEVTDADSVTGQVDKEAISIAGENKEPTIVEQKEAINIAGENNEPSVVEQEAINIAGENNEPSVVEQEAINIAGENNEPSVVERKEAINIARENNEPPIVGESVTPNVPTSDVTPSAKADTNESVPEVTAKDVHSKDGENGFEDAVEDLSELPPDDTKSRLANYASKFKRFIQSKLS
uniref:RAP-1c n=2 Tax=unclassified Babesia TaxID=323723 RepID=A0A088NAC4_9APIC|nr:RAP-1c [Babesia sp. BQ1/Ningxian]AIN51393.1 RAP-1c [Babesia sp. Tianzhu]